MNTSTYSRWSSTVSTTRKSQAMIACAWAVRNCRQVGPDRRGAGSMPAACRISHTVDPAITCPSRASSPWILRWPQAGFSRHPDDQHPDRGPGGRSSWTAPVGVIPFAGDKVPVPAQDRGRGDREDLRPPAAAHQPGQRRKPEPVGMIPPQPDVELAAQHLVLMAQHQQLGVLGQVRPDQHRHLAEQAPHQAVDDRQQHPEMVPATLLIPQQNPSSHYETEFPSGTPFPQATIDATSSCTGQRGMTPTNGLKPHRYGSRTDRLTTAGDSPPPGATTACEHPQRSDQGGESDSCRLGAVCLQVPFSSPVRIVRG